MSACWIALGGNVGDVSDTFRRALALLDQTPRISVSRFSRSYTTSPVGTAAGGQFLNAAAELRTSIPPLELLGILHSVETQLGRTRTQHWGPRSLDLDLLLYDQQCVATSTLTLPHPHLWYRRFVLDPLVEIAPDVMHPQHLVTIAELHNRLLCRPLSCSLSGGSVEHRISLQESLAREFPSTVWLDDSYLAQPSVRVLLAAVGIANASMMAAQRITSDVCLKFCLEPVVRLAGTSSPNLIELSSFPTPVDQAIRDVLTSALNAARLVV